MKRRKKILIISFVLGIFILIAAMFVIVSLGSQPTEWSEGIRLTNNSQFREGADTDVSTNKVVSENFCDQGYFYLESNLMKFYDADTNHSYVMCEQPKCQHNSADCPAWYSPDRPIKGLGTVDGKVYAAFWNYTSKKYDLCSLKLNGTNREKIAEIPIVCQTDPENEQWFSADFSIVYVAGYAWVLDETAASEIFEDGVSTTTDFSMMIYGIDLNSGKVTTIDVSKIDPNAYYAEVTAYASGWVLLDVEVYDKAQPYDEYYRFDMSDEEFHLIDQIDAVTYSDDGGLWHLYYPYGLWKDGIICSTLPDYYASSKERTVLYWNLSDNTKTNLFTIKDGTVPIYENNTIGTNITSDNEIYYCEYEYENGEKSLAHNYAYSFETGKIRELFTDTYTFSYRLMGECGSEWLVGKNKTGEGALSRISRADYESGNFKKIKKIW